jgi:DNA-binding response OmpR family regulator
MARRPILVIEDDPAIRDGVVEALHFQGYEPLQAGTYADGLRAALRASYDLLLLDLVLPGGDGLALLGEVRLARPTLPVILVTARGREEDRVKGLELGADDYVVKPFSVKELLARVAAVLRRSAERPLDVGEVRFRGGVADLAGRALRLDGGAPRELSELEACVLRYLAANAARVISRNELLERVWRLPPNQVRTRTIDMLVARLREKLGDETIILTVRGRGYRFAGGV